MFDTWSRAPSPGLRSCKVFDGLGGIPGIQPGHSDRSPCGSRIVRQSTAQEISCGSESVTKLAMLAFLAAAIKESYSLCINVAAQLSPALMMPMIWAYLSVPVGCVFMFIQLLPSFLEDLTELAGRTVVVRPARTAEDRM